MFIKKYSHILAIALLALIVRLWGIDHGFPFLYHPDEPTVVRSAMGIRFGDLNPHHFDWPHLQVYLAYILFKVFIKMRVVLRLLNLQGITESFLPILWDDTIVFYFLARIMTAIMGAITVLLLYKIGKKLYSKTVGIVAALFLTFNSVHVSESHVATIDVPMVMWLTLSLLICVYILKTGKLKYFLLAGLFAGFATSTKYNGGLSVVTIFVAAVVYISRVLASVKEKRSGIILKYVFYLLLAAFSSLLGFFIGTPYALLDWETFTTTEGPKGAFWQFYHVGGEGIRAGFLLRWQRHLKSTLNIAQGAFLNFMSITGVVYLLFKRKGEGLILVIFPVLYFIYVGNFLYAPEHFFIPLYPYLALVASKAMVDFISFIAKTLKFSSVARSVIFIVVLASSLLVPIKETVKADIVLTRKDTRTQAKEWVDSNLPDYSGIALGGDYEPILREKEDEFDEDRGYHLVWLHDLLTGKDLEQGVEPYFNQENIRFVILGSFNFSKETYPRWDKSNPDFWAWVIEYGKLLKEFKSGQNPGPTVLIYKLKY